MRPRNWPGLTPHHKHLPAHGRGGGERIKLGGCLKSSSSPGEAMGTGTGSPLPFGGALDQEFLLVPQLSAHQGLQVPLCCGRKCQHSAGGQAIHPEGREGRRGQLQGASEGHKRG